MANNRVYYFFLFLLFVLGKAFSQQLSLSSSIQIAQQQSYDAMVARLSFMSQYWSYRSFKSEMLPAVNLSGNLFQFNRSMVEARNFDDGRISYVENNSMNNSLSLSVSQNIVALGGKLSVQSYLYRLDQFSYDSKLYNSQPLRLTYTQPLRAYNSLKWQKKTEPLKYERAKRAYLEAMEGVTITVVRLFFNVLSAQSAYQQSVSNLKDRQYLFDIAQRRFELGTVTKSEILQLELSLLNAQVEVNNNLLTLNNQKFSLFSYLRIPNYEQIELLPPYTIPDITINMNDVLSKALANSTHTLSQQVNLLEAQKVVAQTKASKGIQVQLNGEVALSRTADVFRDAFRGMRDNEIVGLTVSLPIFDWGVSKGRVRMAQADLEATKTQLEQAHESYLQNLRMNVLQFNTQAEQCKNALRAQDIADERYEITKRRFETGAVTVTDLNTAQQESENARAQYIRLLQTYWTDYYTLRKATLHDWIRRCDLDEDFDELIKK
ncbi:outer membrane efflux protein [Bacteroides pyogenes F0041]|uniref:Outer membrane efflux protein n=1 Tax=Bacteroides pyogenes F0041 TaxID=1321819 RepID=U2E298_9BACE|nr:TolC family protein [Bacteroides pyogenes]ERI88222.1 outer membrane efflux protein [Bacteroides pyogenes F0041]MDY5354275.1 TolC family protein [Bacteroides pyogenes]